MRIFSRKYTAKQKLSRKRISKKRVFNKKIGGSGDATTPNTHSLIKYDIGSCGKSGLFGRSSCVVLTPNCQGHSCIKSKVALYLNFENTFYVRYLYEDKKYDTKIPIILDANNYNTTIAGIISNFGLVEQTNVARVSADLIAFIVGEQRIYRRKQMLELLREWSDQDQGQGYATSPSPSSPSELTNVDHRPSATYQESLDTCYKLLDTKDFVTYDEKVKTYFAKNKVYGVRQPISTDALLFHKKTQIGKANECVTNVYNADYESNTNSMKAKIIEYEKSKDIMIDGILKRIDANEKDRFD